MNRTSFRTALAAILLATMAVAGVPGAQAASPHAGVLTWLPKQQVTHISLHGYVHPALATYKNHAYVLNVDNGIGPKRVDFSTNESGSWKTQPLTTQRPANEYVALGADQSTGQLFAVFTYRKDANTEAVGVWTRSAAGQWSAAPTEIEVEAAFYGPASVVAGGGKAYIAFGSKYPGACDSRRTDAQVVTYDGSSWSAPHNVTSCVPGANMEFDNPKIAMDESGRLFLTTLEARNNLWYTDTTSGSWSTPVQITNGADIGDRAVSFAQRGTYSIAASNRTAYVAYAKHGATVIESDVFIMTHAAGGGWSGPSKGSPTDVAGCSKWGVSLVAQAGRIGLSYVNASSGQCKRAGNPDPTHSSPHLLIGTPGALTAVNLGGGQDCVDTTLSSDGPLFRLLTNCSPTPGAEHLFYTAEALVTAAPAARLDAPTSVTGSTIPLKWGPRDAQQKANVTSYDVQVRDGTLRYTIIYKKTHATSTRYRHAK